MFAPGQPARPLPARTPARRRRHGPGLAGRARRRPVPAPAGAEAAAPGLCRPQPAPALLARARDPGPPATSPHRAPARCRRGRRRPALPGAGIRGRGGTDRLLPPACAVGGRAPAAVRAGVRGGQLRPRQPDRAPRPEAFQHAGHRQPPGTAAGFRHRHPARPRWRRAEPSTHRGARLHPALRRARTGARRTGEHPHRRLFAGRGAVRAAGRRQALPAAAAERCRMGAGDPGGVPATTLAGGAAPGRNRATGAGPGPAPGPTPAR